MSLLLSITLCTVTVANAMFGIFRNKDFSVLVPVSVALCGVSAVLAIVDLILIIRDHKKLTEKTRSILCLVGLFVLCGLEIWMCASTVSDINAKRNAENSAVNFIKDKYGIDAEADYEKSFSSDSRTWTTVKMTADGKDFYVERCTNTDGNTIFADDYQLEEIKQAVFDEVSRVYPNGTLRDVQIYGRNLFFHEVIEKYFDGTNLDEVMSCQHGSIAVDFADTKFDLDGPLFKKLDEWCIRPFFTSFDTTEHRDEFVAAEQLGHYNDYDERYAKYAHYITDRVKHEYGKAGEKDRVLRMDYDIKTNGEFDYLYRDIAENENGAEKIEQRFARYADTALGKPVTKVYKREYSGSSSFYIYYPLEKLNGTAVENIEAAWISDSAGSNNAFGTQNAEVIGDYAVFVLPYFVEEFIIVDAGSFAEDNSSG